MAVFRPSVIAEVMDADDPDGQVVEFLEVASARGGGLIYAPTAGQAGQIAGEEDRAALRLTHEEAMKLVDGHAWALEQWTVRDDPDHEADQGLRLSMVEDADGEPAGWCVRDATGRWQGELNADRQVALDLLRDIVAERARPARPDKH